MSACDAFYIKFRGSVLGNEAHVGAPNSPVDRVRFLKYQFDIVPANLKVLISNMTRGHPTSPIYAFLAIGVIGTNIARHSAVRRIGANRDQAERTGTFYNFIAPSRVGKVIAMSLIAELGGHVEEIREEAYTTRMDNEPRVDPEGNVISRKTIEQRSAILRPHAVFLTGANGLQTQALAAENAGCGLISVPEINNYVFQTL